MPSKYQLHEKYLLAIKKAIISFLVKINYIKKIIACRVNINYMKSNYFLVINYIKKYLLAL